VNPTVAWPWRSISTSTRWKFIPGARMWSARASPAGRWPNITAVAACRGSALRGRAGRGRRRIRIHFHHAAGLRTCDGAAPSQDVHRRAEPHVRLGRVPDRGRVSYRLASGDPRPASVRYAWANNPLAATSSTGPACPPRLSAPRVVRGNLVVAAVPAPKVSFVPKLTSLRSSLGTPLPPRNFISR